MVIIIMVLQERYSIMCPCQGQIIEYLPSNNFNSFFQKHSIPDIIKHTDKHKGVHIDTSIHSNKNRKLNSIVFIEQVTRNSQFLLITKKWLQRQYL